MRISKRRSSIARSTARTLALLLAIGTSVQAAEVVRAARWELHSSFWMSLHQRLLADVWQKTPRDLSALAPDELAIWNEAVAAYRKASGEVYDPTFARPMMITTDALAAVADDAMTPLIDSQLAETLLEAAPVYRKHWWAADDKANRFFIAYAAGMLRDAGEELVAAHEKVYRSEWPRFIRVYVTPEAGPYGAYTSSFKSSGPLTTMSSRDPGYQGLLALEMMLHESSHIVVGPNSNNILGRTIAEAAKKHEAKVDGLWHAILFATSSELTKRLLAERGSPQFVPSSADLLTRVWSKYRPAIEKHWYPYLSGKGTLEEAIDRVVAEIPR